MSTVPLPSRCRGYASRLGLDSSPWLKLQEGRQVFGWQHLGRSTAPVGEVLGALGDLPLLAPRTGHLADWSDIFGGRSSVLDYNLVICRLLGLGRPLLYDFNQTEDLALSSGDSLFLPGSLLSGGVRHVLPLRRWTPTGLRPYDRAGSLFVPYVEADFGGEHRPLAGLHRQRNAGSAPAAECHSEFVLREQERITELLTVLVQAAGADERALAQIFDRVVHRDGRVERTALRQRGDGYVLGGAVYRSATALAEASFLPARVAQAAAALGDILPQIPETAPLLSLNVIVLLYAALGAHRRPGQPAVCGSFDLHVQWGALAMGGYPPHSRGYFASRAGKIRGLYEIAVRELPWVVPMIFVMAPAAPFLLWPSSREPRDVELVDALLDRVLSAIAKRPQLAGDTTAVIGEAAAQWWTSEGTHISPAFLQQLRWSSRLSPSGDPLPPGEPRKPARFDGLTMSQACQLVGAMIKEVS